MVQIDSACCTGAIAHIAPNGELLVCGRDRGPDGASVRKSEFGLELCDPSLWLEPMGCCGTQDCSVLPRGEPGGVSDAKGWGGIARWPEDLLLPR